MRVTRALLTLALVALLGAGCAGGSEEKDATGATTEDTPTATPLDGAVRFAECMRDNGVTEFPDPDASGELTLDGVVNGSSIDPDGAAWKQAVGACRDLEPSGFTGRERDAGQQELALRFAQCMRDNGVTDFPDPVPDAPLVDTNRIPSAAREGGMTILNAAMQTCGEHAEKLLRREP